MQEQSNTVVSNLILDGYVSIEKMATDLGYESTRSVDRLTQEPDGLPYIVVNRKKYFNVERARQWFAAREIQRNQKRQQHRRRKAA